MKTVATTASDCDCENECKKESGCLYWQRKLADGECLLFDTEALGTLSNSGYAYGMIGCQKDPMCPLPTDAPPTSIPLTQPPDTNPPVTQTPVVPTTDAPKTQPPATPAPTIAPPTPVPVVPATNPPLTQPPATAEPTSQPIGVTAQPTAEPTAPPTAEPTAPPTAEPTAEPTAPPTAQPTAPPTAQPTAPPTAQPTAEPTAAPTAPPTAEPTAEPTAPPTAPPTAEPTAQPTAQPTAEPTAQPTAQPTAEPTAQPTTTPRTLAPDTTAVPTAEPTAAATSPPATSTPVTNSPRTSTPPVKVTSVPEPVTEVPTQAPTQEPTEEPLAAVAVVRKDSTSPGIQSAADAAVPAVAVLGATAALSGQRLALMLGTGCGTGDDSSSDQLPFNLHPTRLSIGDTSLAFHVGCVIGNLFIIVAGFTLLHLVFLYCMTLCGLVKGDNMEIQGFVKFPAVTMFLFLFLLQGTSLGAARLAFSGGPWTAVGGGTFVLCLMFIVYVYLVLRDVHKKAVYRDDSTTSTRAAYFIGKGEWLSTTDSYIDRFGVMFRRYLPHASKFVMWDMSLSIGISLASAVKANTMVECGHKRVAMGSMTLSYMLLLMYVRPFAHGRNNHSEIFGQLLQTVGLGIIAIAFYSEDRSHWGFEVGMYLILAAMVFLVMKTLGDFIAFMYVLKTKRRPRLYAEVYQNEEEMKEEPLIEKREGSQNIPSSDLSWRGLLSDLALPPSQTPSSPGQTPQTAGSPSKITGKRPGDLTWENLVSDVDSIHNNGPERDTSFSNAPTAPGSFQALPRYGSLRLTEEGSFSGPPPLKFGANARLNSVSGGSFSPGSGDVGSTSLRSDRNGDSLTWDKLIEDVAAPTVPKKGVVGSTPSLPPTAPRASPPPLQKSASLAAIGGGGDGGSDAGSEPLANKRRSGNFASISLSPRSAPKDGANFVPTRKAKKKQIVVYT